MSHAGDPFGQPNRTDVPAPLCAFIKQWSRETDRTFRITTKESTVAELFEFENAKAAKKLMIFVWTVAHEREYAHTALHYAFQLQVVDA